MTVIDCFRVYSTDIRHKWWRDKTRRSYHVVGLWKNIQ